MHNYTNNTLEKGRSIVFVFIPKPYYRKLMLIFTRFSV